MKKICKVILAAVAIAVLAVPAMAANDKLVVKAADGSHDAFKVDDAGALTGQYWDGANSKYVINNYFNPATKKYGFGTSNPLSSLHITEEAANVERGLTMAQHTTGGQAAIININRSRNTEASPTILVLGDNVAAFHAKPFSGQAWVPPATPAYTATASLIWTIDGVVAVDSAPTATIFYNGSNAATRLERLRVSSDGSFRVSNQPTAPANNATCTVGDLRFDVPAGYLYMCVATNSWKRTAFVAY